MSIYYHEIIHSLNITQQIWYFSDIYSVIYYFYYNQLYKQQNKNTYTFIIIPITQYQYKLMIRISIILDSNYNQKYYRILNGVRDFLIQNPKYKNINLIYKDSQNINNQRIYILFYLLLLPISIKKYFNNILIILFDKLFNINIDTYIKYINLIYSIYTFYSSLIKYIYIFIKLCFY